jgi:hypothetical protein
LVTLLGHAKGDANPNDFVVVSGPRRSTWTRTSTLPRSRSASPA